MLMIQGRVESGEIRTEKMERKMFPDSTFPDAAVE